MPERCGLQQNPPQLSCGQDLTVDFFDFQPTTSTDQRDHFFEHACQKQSGLDKNMPGAERLCTSHAAKKLCLTIKVIEIPSES